MRGAVIGEYSLYFLPRHGNLLALEEPLNVAKILRFDPAADLASVGSSLSVWYRELEQYHFFQEV